MFYSKRLTTESVIKKTLEERDDLTKRWYALISQLEAQGFDEINRGYLVLMMEQFNRLDKILMNQRKRSAWIQPNLLQD